MRNHRIKIKKIKFIYLKSHNLTIDTANIIFNDKTLEAFL